jgi:hypothetical protein
MDKERRFFMLSSQYLTIWSEYKLMRINIKYLLISFAFRVNTHLRQVIETLDSGHKKSQLRAT